MDIIDRLNTFFPDLNNFQYVYDDIFPTPRSILLQKKI